MNCRPNIWPSRRDPSAFTIIEIALCLAIIGIALVSILGVLPIGMNTQRDTREETVVNQDATLLLEDIRNGVRGANDLTNYVYAITNFWTLYNANGSVNRSGKNSYSYGTVSVPQAYPSTPFTAAPLTNGANIIGLLSTPEFIANPTASNINNTSYPAIPNLFNVPGYSNHIVALVRSLSGSAAEKPPQNNAIMVEDTFTYKLLVVNAPMAMDTNIYNLPLAQQAYVRQLAGSQRELRMTWLWPVQPNGSVGNGRQTFRATIAGQLAQQTVSGNNNLYFYQSQSYTNAP
jgi:type II secretory pathway pseudopilin PulG